MSRVSPNDIPKDWTPKRKIDESKKTRQDRKDQFKTWSDPSKLVNNQRISHPNETEGDIKSTFKDILKLDLMTLRDRLQEGKYNAYTVLCAFVWRSIQIDDQINCITEYIKEAFEKAEKCDDDWSDKEEKPLLYGLPFSVKSNFNVKDYDVTVGLTKYLNSEKDNTCPMVQFLSDKGAIPFCLTNVPQGLLSYVSSNPLYGTTKNPWDFSRTPGGSSGGEAALLAAGGSAFGIGSDLAGSLRIPAAFCGLVTLKPTQDRLYVSDTHGGLPGRGRLGLSFGFYTKTVKEQQFLLNLIVGNRDYLELCPMSAPAPFNELPKEWTPKKIGWFVNDGFNPVVPSNQRAVEVIRDKLEAEGYEVVEFKLSEVSKNLDFDPFKIADMLFRNVMPDNGKYMSELYSNEPFDQYMSLFIHIIRWKQNPLFSFVIRLVMPLIRTLFSRRFACIGSARNSDLAACRQNQENTDIFKLEWIRYWKEKEIDALICPSFITPAQPFKYPAELSSGAFITGLFNMLDVPAGIVPVDVVTQNDVDSLDDRDDEKYFNDEGDFLLRKQRDAARGSAGLPNCVQVVTLPNCEEKCLKVMELIEKLDTGKQTLQWIDFEDRDNANGVGTSEHFFRRV